MTRLMRIPEVTQTTGLTKSTVYDLIRKNRFPRPIKLSERASAWRADELEKWIAARTKASRLAPMQASV
jgi:prophage regulatory protein